MQNSGPALAALLAICWGCGGNAAAPETPAGIGAAVAEAAPPTLNDAPPAPIGKMPACQGEGFELDLLDAISALPDDTLEAQREQVRDWVWHVTLAKAATTAAVDNAFAGIADEPLLRDDALRHVLTLPTGTTRSTTTKGGEVVVLVDAVNEPDLTGRVLEAIDEQALGLGRTPQRARVFAFELQRDTAIAKVCPIKEYDTAALENGAAGFRQMTVSNLPELEQFLSGGVDLLSAECEAAGLKLAGRQRPRNAAAPISPAHIAALAQELNVSYLPPAQFGTSIAALPRDERAHISEQASTLDQLDRFSSSYSIPDKFTAQLLDWKRRNPSASSADILLSASLQSALDGKPGFSLDPEFKARDVLARIDELATAMRDSKSLVAKLREWGASSVTAADFVDADDRLPELREELQTLRDSISQLSDDDVGGALWQATASDSSLGALASELRARSGSQCARYDGPFAGTEAGLTFFYTDVVAKFFISDFDRHSPEDLVPGFESVVNAVSSTAWCGEPKRPGTRIWYGLLDEGYTRETLQSVRFAPTTTRLFAKGSAQPGSDEQETEPNASFRRFIGWWNAHYAAIAGWEPQYELLNQLGAVPDLLTKNKARSIG